MLYKDREPKGPMGLGPGPWVQSHPGHYIPDIPPGHFIARKIGNKWGLDTMILVTDIIKKHLGQIPPGVNTWGPGINTPIN